MRKIVIHVLGYSIKFDVMRIFDCQHTKGHNYDVVTGFHNIMYDHLYTGGIFIQKIKYKFLV